MSLLKSHTSNQAYQSYQRNLNERISEINAARENLIDYLKDTNKSQLTSPDPNEQLPILEAETISMINRYYDLIIKDESKIAIQKIEEELGKEPPIDDFLFGLFDNAP